MGGREKRISGGVIGQGPLVIQAYDLFFLGGSFFFFALPPAESTGFALEKGSAATRSLGGESGGWLFDQLRVRGWADNPSKVIMVVAVVACQAPLTEVVRTRRGLGREPRWV